MSAITILENIVAMLEWGFGKKIGGADGNVHTDDTIITNKQNQPRCPSTDEWIMTV
jgi:hypothetical protein